MAKMGKSKLAKVKKPRSQAALANKVTAPKAVSAHKGAKAVVKATAKKDGTVNLEAKTAKPMDESSKATKKVSQKLLETIEKRRKTQGKAPLFSKPPGRRGRRPKSAGEYTPENQEEDVYVMESEAESLEYDTGIRVSKAKDDGAFNLDRFEEFDEELNFDW